MSPHDSKSIARRGEHLENIAICFFVLSWTFIALRTWTRTCVISQFGWDDSTMILAGMIFSAYCACILYIEANGGGTHITSAAQITMLTKWVIASEVTYILTVLTVKISLGIFFARIIVQRWQHNLIHVTLAVTALSSISSCFYCIFRCGPDINDYVLRQLVNKCTPRALDRFFAYQHAAFSFLTDGVFATLPVFIVWNIHMKRHLKFHVGFILSLAALGCICSAIRFQYVEGLTQIEDFFWNATNISVWSTIEPGVGIVAACLATLRPFLKWACTKAQSLRSSFSHSAQQISHSTGSRETPSKQQGDSSSNGHPCRYINSDAEAQHDELIELRSESSKKGESTEYILSQGRALNGPSPSEMSRSLELDRMSTRTTRDRDVEASPPRGEHLLPRPLDAS
ncbi:hypothetical protein K458DRAFT_389651 [Lentithecium fluviatile CBS 122367]|uniref:Rhodopsin domain-containing protein n=1 Tax=Lentithecium fluviatile CBS 122367 TaxID=1168545 RepID=A0A6G1J0I2_9PLEO|nr:hypothetical protein K458DRAFT_389651 [Lentithecium fluviatile CBS 122367]